MSANESLDRIVRDYEAALQHAVFDEVAEPLGQYLARDAEVGLDLVEAVHPDPYVTQDQR